MHHCSRCKRDKSFDDFPPSKARNASQWCRQCIWEYKCGPQTTRACDGCGTVMEVSTRRAAEVRVYCSRACHDQHRRWRERQGRLIAKMAASLRACPHCGEAIDKVGLRIDARFCSERCQQAARNATRKASWKVGERQQRISRAYIIERDGSRCHACGKKCQPDEIHLDHLIPLARGGTHTPENLRVACARCNLSRRDRGEAQLLLIG